MTLQVIPNEKFFVMRSELIQIFLTQYVERSEHCIALTKKGVEKN